jgi:hypothetical protein
MTALGLLVLFGVVKTFAFVAGMLPLLVARGVGAGDNRAIGSVIAAAGCSPCY